MLVKYFRKMKMKNIELYKNQIRKLKQNSNKTEEEIELLAQQKIKQEELLDSISYLSDDVEKKFALNLLNEYAQYNLESPSEKDTLNQLIYIDILIERVKKFLNIESSKANPTVPISMTEELRNLNEQSLKLKEALGMNKDKKDSNLVETLDELEKKALAYYEEHKGCNEFQCPYCQGIFHLLWDRTNCKEIKSVWFKGTMLYNEALLDLYDKKIIDKEKCAEILGVSDYEVDIVYELFLNEKAKNDKKNNK